MAAASAAGIVARVALVVAGLVIAVVAAGLIVLYAQAKRRPDTSGQYVALGSSFAAGFGLGARAPASPIVCMRTTGGYPSLLARKLGLTLVDMSCSGSTTRHILSGGQVFLGPQLDAVGPATRLVTITSGGNDVGYIGDLMSASGSMGRLGRLLAPRRQPIAPRDFGGVTDNLVRIVEQVRRRAPRALVAIVTYPAIIPGDGLCPELGIDEATARQAREVARRLDAATHAAAERSGALLVDMAAASAPHHACAAQPWINGARPQTGSAFHPNALGAQAVAEAVAEAVIAALPRELTGPASPSPR